MRALLIANPKATSTSTTVRDVLLRELGNWLKVDLAETHHRGHATDLAADAARDGYDVVIALGGDGTVNEAVNGLLSAGVAEAPDFAVIPAGSANVFARAIGLPNDPLAAAARVRRALRTGERRTVSLGLADDRYFTFCAGAGLDAEVVHAVESARKAGSRADGSLYVRTALRQFFSGTDRRRPALTLKRAGMPDQAGLFLGIVTNTSPWTYLGNRRVDASPGASFETGLDLFALRWLGAPTTLMALARMLAPRVAWPLDRNTVRVRDAAEFTLWARRPVAFQLDGDYLGERKHVTFRSVSDALRVVT